MKTRKLMLTVASTAVLALALTACSSDAETTATETTTVAESQPSSEPSPTEEITVVEPSPTEEIATVDVSPLSGNLTEADFPNATLFTEVQMEAGGVVNIPPITGIDEYTLNGGDYNDYAQKILFDPELVNYVNYDDIVKDGPPKNVVYLTKNMAGTPMMLSKDASGSVAVIQEYVEPNETVKKQNVYLLQVG